MLQRIQSIYLILAAITLSLSLFLPIIEFTTAENQAYVLDVYSLSESNSGESSSAEGKLGLLILIPLTVVSILFTIFQFSNRKRQMTIGNLLYLMLAGIITLMMFFIEGNKTNDLVTMGYGIGYFGPIAALPFVFLANRGIKKDENLIKSLDRLR